MAAGRGQKTLERVISKAGLGSRKEARAWIHAQRVQVNGRIIENPDHWIDFERDRIDFDGKPLQARKKLYILLYKPTGYVTTYRDPEGRKTVYDLLADVPSFVGTVGRLDEDSSGLLLLTNDTQFAERLTNPAYHVPKTYLVKCASVLSEEALAALRAGVALSDGPTQPAEVKRVRDSDSKTFVEITIHEGRNRQVRRMIEAVGSRVLKLVRIRFGPLEIGDLKSGTWRLLTAAEVGQFPRPARERSQR
jgi:pseudouridine synthase